MPIKVVCSCGNMILVKGGLQGRRVKCPACGAGMVVPMDSQQEQSLEGVEEYSPPQEAAMPRSRKPLVYGSIIVGALIVAVIAYVLIVGSPFSGTERDKNGKKKEPPLANKSKGKVDVVDSRHVTGWAWDPERPNEPINVDIYDGDKLLATVPADQFRQDLSKLGNGKHRFLFPIPAELKDGQEHVIRVKITGTDIELKNSPKTATFTKGPKTKDKDQDSKTKDQDSKTKDQDSKTRGPGV
jgi:hypothetical protein